MKIAVYQLTAVTLVKWYTAGGLDTNGAIALCIEIQLGLRTVCLEAAGRLWTDYFMSRLALNHGI